MGLDGSVLMAEVLVSLIPITIFAMSGLIGMTAIVTAHIRKMEEIRRRAASPEDLRLLVEEVGRLRGEVKALQADRLRERQLAEAELDGYPLEQRLKTQG